MDSVPIAEYELLKTRVEAAGLFRRTYGRYAGEAAIAFLGSALSLYLVTVTDNALFQFCNALFFGVMSARFGTLSHDLSHGMVFASPQVNRVVASLSWGLCVGLSETRWFENHNAHHKRPNHIGHDPDLRIPFMFSEKQVGAKTSFHRTWILPYQHVIFWPLLMFVYSSYILMSMRFTLQRFSLVQAFELLLMGVHFAVLFYFPLVFLPLPVALLFLATVFAFVAVYMGFVFAPNHKGMPELDTDGTFNWIQQITSTRNIIPSWPIFYLMGGLNFQIEHHLFPTMSRFKSAETRMIVKEFCKERNIPYHETTWVGSVRELYNALAKEALQYRTVTGQR
jgi:fatty acid desaturase